VVDIVDSKTRSRMMSRIRGRDTIPELRLRKALHKLGYRYRLNARELPGRPDLVFPKFRAVVLIHGCFWHRHSGCRFATTPASNVAFWQQKFDKNLSRDACVLEELRTRGWRVGVVWECALEGPAAAASVDSVAKWLPSRKLFLEIPS
jgi:DNA mismatch endonuclease, patch repair protein